MKKPDLSITSQNDETVESEWRLFFPELGSLVLFFLCQKDNFGM